MPAKAFVMTQQEYVRPYEVLGMHITVLVSGEKTGSYELVRQTGPEGSGLPPHRHPWDESNYVIKGDVEFGLGEEITWGTAARCREAVRRPGPRTAPRRGRSRDPHRNRCPLRAHRCRLNPKIRNNCHKENMP
ncbi:MAG: hypothetical protein P8076_03125 [Gammaproteobacteria bacterium]